jgi:hypothetical protein
MIKNNMRKGRWLFLLVFYEDYLTDGSVIDYFDCR